MTDFLGVRAMMGAQYRVLGRGHKGGTRERKACAWTTVRRADIMMQRSHPRRRDAFDHEDEHFEVDRTGEDHTPDRIGAGRAAPEFRLRKYRSRKRCCHSRIGGSSRSGDQGRFIKLWARRNGFPMPLTERQIADFVAALKRYSVLSSLGEDTLASGASRTGEVIF